MRDVANTLLFTVVQYEMESIHEIYVIPETTTKCSVYLNRYKETLVLGIIKWVLLSELWYNEKV